MESLRPSVLQTAGHAIGERACESNAQRRANCSAPGRELEFRGAAAPSGRRVHSQATTVASPRFRRGCGFAHLLNNALMVVRGALEKLRSATRPVEIQPAAAIIDVTQRVGSTLRDLRVVSRGDEPEPRPLELSRELDAIAAKIAPTIGADIKLRVHGTPGLTVHRGASHRRDPATEPESHDRPDLHRRGRLLRAHGGRRRAAPAPATACSSRSLTPDVA